MMDVNDVEVWMFDDKIPNALEIDALHMIPKDPILVKDLVNYLPISMHMHKSMKKIWQYPVCKILSNENSTIFARLLPFDMEDDDEDDDDDSLINRDLKPLSLKGSPPTPVSKASSKVFAQLKDKGATIENIKQVLKEKRDKGRKIVLEDREWRRKYGNGGEGGDDGQVDE